MKVLRNIIESEKTNLGKLELVKQIKNEISNQQKLAYENKEFEYHKNTFILGLILSEIETKPTWGKNQLKDLFLEKILDNL